ncbi:MAG: hypothetical protein AAF709_09675, partial [Pseudomonadota bacterium]
MTNKKQAFPLVAVVSTTAFVVGIGGWILNDVLEGRWPWPQPIGAKNVTIDVARLLPKRSADEKRSITVFRTVKAPPDLRFITGIKFKSSGDALSHSQYCYVERTDEAGTRRVLQLADIVGTRQPKFVAPSDDQA